MLVFLCYKLLQWCYDLGPLTDSGKELLTIMSGAELFFEISAIALITIATIMTNNK